jgi:hypothetical protein
MNKSRQNKQRGQATAEWTIATMILIGALFVPYNGKDSAMSNFMKKLRSYNADSTYFISLP